MGKKTILVVNAEAESLELLQYALKREGYQVHFAPDLNKIDEIAQRFNPNLIVLDIEIDGKHGFSVLKTIKKDPYTSYIPVVMLTNKNNIEEEIACLEIGADDFISKPFSPRVLAARIKAVLRSRETQNFFESDYIQVRDMEIDPKRRVAVINGKTVDLTYSEFEILFCLAKNPGWVLSRDDIINSVHGKEYSVADRSVDVQIYGLRKKLGHCGKYVETIRGIGYRLNA